MSEMCGKVQKNLNFENFWKSGRAVDCGALEKRWAEMFRRFESCLFRFYKVFI